MLAAINRYISIFVYKQFDAFLYRMMIVLIKLQYLCSA